MIFSESQNLAVDQRNVDELVIYFETSDMYLHKLNGFFVDGEDSIDNRNSELHSENGDAAHPSAVCSVDRSENAYSDGCSALNFSKMLKKVLYDIMNDPGSFFFCFFEDGVVFSVGYFFPFLF